MIGSRMLRDDALWMLPVFAVNAAVVSSVFLGVLALKAQKVGAPATPGWLFGVVWIGVAWYLAFGRTRTRAAGIDLVLPLPARRMWVGHVLAVLAGGMVVAAGPLLVLLGWSRAFRSMTPHPYGIGADTLVVWLAAGLMLAVVLLEAVRPRLARRPARGRWRAWVAVVTLGVPVLVVELARLGPGWLLIVPLAVAFVGVAVYRAIPDGFTEVPRDAVAERPRVAARDANVAVSGWRTSPAMVVLRIVAIGSKEWMFMPFMFLIGAVIGGGIGWAGLEGRWFENRFSLVPMILYMLMAGIPLRLMSVHRLDALPISRRFVFMMSLLPSFVVLLIGYGIGALGAHRFEPRHEAVTLVEGRNRLVVLSPPGMMRIAWNGVPPAATAPWGETQDPGGVPVVRGLRPVAYSPYRTPEGSSPDYVAWQAGRALSDAYGTPVSWREVRERYITVRPDGTPAVAAGGLTWFADHPGLAPHDRGPVLALVLVAGLMPFLFVFGLFLRFFRAGHSERRRIVVYWVLVALVFAVWLTPFFTDILGLVWEGVATGGPFAIVTAWAGASAARTAWTWIVAVLGVATGWWFAERAFRRMEIPARPIKLSLVDCLRSD